MLANGIDVNAHEEEGGETALMKAARKGHAVIVEVLLAHGADIAAQDRRGAVAVHYAGSGKVLDACSSMGSMSMRKTARGRRLCTMPPAGETRR